MENNQFSANGLDLLWVTITHSSLGVAKTQPWYGEELHHRHKRGRVFHSWLSKDFLTLNTVLFDLLAKECNESKHEV